MPDLDAGGAAGKAAAGRERVIAGRVTDVGEDYIVLGSTERIFLVEGLASGFHTGERVTITAVVAADGKLTAYKIALARS